MIRSITIGVNNESFNRDLEDINTFVSDAKANSPVKIRTFRLSLEPYVIKKTRDLVGLRPLLDTLDVFCKESIIRWYCIPFNYVNSSPAIVNDGAFEILSRRPNAFVNLIASNKNGTNIPNLSVIHYFRFQSIDRFVLNLTNSLSTYSMFLT